MQNKRKYERKNCFCNIDESENCNVRENFFIYVFFQL